MGEKTLKQTVGTRGERLAADTFKKMGYKLIEKNFRASHYEIDLIVCDKECIVFVEVKASSCEDPENMTYGRPARAVTHSKQSFLINAARSYLKQNPKYDGMRVRFDVFEVFFDNTPDVSNKKILKTNHIRNAFGA